MSTRVSNLFPPSPEPPYDMARHCLGPILPEDHMWEVSFSPREAQFKCYTKIPSEIQKSGSGEPLELGVCLRFTITKENELYAQDITPSKKHTSKVASGQTQAAMKRELISKIKRRWKKELKISGVRTEF